MPKFEKAIPNPANLIQSLRDIGYSLETAAADIIDNSITAGADTINILAGFDNTGAAVTFIDNGCGMTEAELKKAMILGSVNPLDVRSKNDLGRFGLGLKTASFSQAKRLTVISRRNGCISARSWDLECFESGDINEWQVLVFSADEIKRLPCIDLLPDDGTIVRWETLDRIVDGSGRRKTSDVFTERISDMRRHLELVYHRYLAGEPGLKKISILINNEPLIPFDPFNSSKAGTPFPPEEVNGIQIKAFLLPHHSKVSRAEYEKLATRSGYLKSQGFYVYRNKRLLVYGTWLRLAAQEELTKLARVRIDLPNDQDYFWAIDIKKSRAVPPELIKQELKRVIDRIRETAKNVYVHRGTVVNARNTCPLWKEKHSDESVSFQINTAHPIVKAFCGSLNDELKIHALQLFRLLESNIPIDSLFAIYAASPKKLTGFTADERELSEYADKFFALMKEIGCPDDTAYQEFLKTDPFHKNQTFANKYLQSIKDSANAQ